MRVGIDASFLRKPGTGIGQVTTNFLRELAGLCALEKDSKNPSKAVRDTEFILYTEEPISLDLPKNFKNRHFLPKWWKRDDVPRKWLWERELSVRAKTDGCQVFLSLSQSATVFHESSIVHVMLVHDIIPRLFPEYLGNIRRKLYWKFVERGIRSSSRLITVSEASKRDVIREIGVPGSRITVVYPDIAPAFRTDPIDDKIVSETLLQYGLRPGYIYHGGGLEVRKNTERLLRAYTLLRSVRGDVPQLVISGKIFDERNPFATPVRSLVAELGLHDSVRLLGFVPDEDLPSLYRGALFFAYPSLYEGFGLPVVEAFASRAPVLAGKSSGSIPEVARDSALLIDISDTAAITEGLARLIDDPMLRSRLSEKGWYRSKDFSWNRFTKGIMEAIGLP